MRDAEAQEWFDMLFPVNGERWVKVKYLDQDKCIKAFRLTTGLGSGSKEIAAEKGYEITSIGFRDEWTPQVAALVDLKDQIVSFLAGSHAASYVKDLFDQKIQELRKHTIKTPLDDRFTS